MAKSKYVFIQLRGGMDGLAALMPDDQTVLKAKRPGLLIDGYRRTDSGFAFHPALKNMHGLFQNSELSFLHACGLPVRDRSHFKSQDMLETGQLGGIAKTGWLGTILEHLPKDREAVAFGPKLPLILKGTHKSFNWSSPQITSEDEALMDLLGKELYTHDRQLDHLLDHVRRIEDLSGGFRRDSRNPNGFEIIGKMLARADGPDIGYIGLGNWDTHDDQNIRIAREFKNLDDGLAVLKQELGDNWNETIVTIVSEFGRSVHENGTKGTDHGTGGLCLIAGGAVAGGESLGAWPGLKEADLFKGRDLYPAHDVRMVFANIARAHLDISSRLIEKTLFPDLPAHYIDLEITQNADLFGFV